MKTALQVLSLMIAGAVVIAIGERNMFFSGYPVFVLIFSAVALLLAVTAVWTGAKPLSDNDIPSDDF